MTPRRRQSERGFALLFAFALAAAIAIMFYLELPRLTFEAQREKEELLVMRGEEYIRGTQLFIRKNKKYPQNLDELEKYNNLRFLRRRYRDPMTGADEWRLIHVDGTGQLTDSLVHKPAGKDKDKESGTSILASNIQGIGAAAEVVQPGGTPVQNAAIQRRASDRIIPTGQGAPDNPNPDGTQQSPSDGESRSGATAGQALPPFPGQVAGQQIPGIPGVPGQNVQPGQLPVAGRGAFPNQLAGNIQMPGTQMPGAQPVPNQPSSTSGFASSTGFGGSSAFGGSGFGGSASTTPGGQPNPNNPVQNQQGGFGGMGMSGGMVGQAPPVPTGGAQTGQPNPALQMIQNIISNPRPGGLAGTGARQGAGVGGQQLGGGIAGVASKKDAESIRVYNERTNYKEWEFIYDQSKEQQAAAAKQGIPGQNQPPSPLNQPGSPFQQVPRQQQ